MKNDNEMKFIEDSNEQNYSPVPNDPPNDGDSGKLSGVKMVRIRIATKCSLKDLMWAKPYYQINSISKIDDNNHESENEVPLLEAELINSRFSCQPPQFDFVDVQSKQPYSTSKNNDLGVKHKICLCCGLKYEEYPNIHTSKAGNAMDTSVTKCYDSRSFYRTFEYQGVAYYKIGEPYKCEFVCPCCCFQIKEKKCGFFLPCWLCCKPEEKKEKENRTYVDIFNMSDQCVGKYAFFFNQTGCPLCGCCQETTAFFEVYFPTNANEMLKLSLIGNLIFIMNFGIPIFGVLPGTKDNLSTWVE